jgi:hypothetical protein
MTWRLQKQINPDAELIALVRQHDRLWAEWDQTEEGDRRAGELSCACDQIERRVVLMPAFTMHSLAGKRRVLRRAAFDDLDGAIARILQVDAERVAAAR